MARGEFDIDDIYIWLSHEDIIHLHLLEIKNNKIIHPPLEIQLKTKEGKDLTAIILHEQFDDLGDGIDVKRTDYGFFIKFNDKAYCRIVDNPISGTRYDGSNKIHIMKED